MADSLPFVVHLGFMRTGTTTHQRHVFANLEQIHYLGKPFTDQHFRKAFYELACRDAAHYDEGTNRHILISGVRNTGASAASCTLLSDEVMLSPQGVEVDVLIKRLHAVFGDFKALITIREQVDVFRSWCEHVLFKREYGALESIVEYQLKFKDRRDSLVGFLDYYEYYRFFRERLGRDQVLMLPYELLRSQPKTYANMLGSFLGISAESLMSRFDAAPRANSRRSAGEIAFCDFKKRHLSGRRRPIPDRAGKILFELFRFNSRHVNKLMQDAQTILVEQFAPKNVLLRESLLNDLRIDIAELGYSLPSQPSRNGSSAKWHACV